LICSRTALRLVGAVGLPADQVPAVPAGDADSTAGGQHARPGDQFGADGVAHAELGVVATAQITHRGDTGLHRLSRAQHRLDDGRRVQVALHGGGWICLTAEAQVDVAVDETGQQREAVEPERRARRGLALGHHGGDAPALHDHGPPGDRRRPAAVDESGAGQDGRIHGER
jgi:hypothetical protein